MIDLALAMPPGAFAASRRSHSVRAVPRERVREQLRVSVWEAEGGALLPEGASLHYLEPPARPPIRR